MNRGNKKVKIRCLFVVEKCRMVTNTGDNGFMLMISEDTDRGIARGTLSFNEDEFLDMEKKDASNEQTE